MASIYKLSSFGNISLVGFEETDSMGTGRAPTSYFRMPGGGAIDNFGTQQTFPGQVARDKNVIFAQSTNILLQSKINQLTKLRGVRDKLYRLNVEGGKEFVYARLAHVGIPRKTLNSRDRINVTQSLSLAFVMESDEWQGILQGEWFLNDGEYLNDILELNSGLVHIATGSPETFDIEIVDTATESGLIVRSMQIIVKAPVGTGYTQFLPVHDDTGESFSFNAVVAADEEVIVNTGNFTVLHEGADAYDNLAVVDVGDNPHSWFSLYPGVNPITVHHNGIYSISFIFREMHT